MKSVTFFMYDLDGENVPNAASQAQESVAQVKKLENKATPVKKPNLWQRIKSELQGWSNKDAEDSAYDDTQV
jgi:hypothetical protein